MSDPVGSDGDGGRDGRGAHRPERAPWIALAGVAALAIVAWAGVAFYLLGLGGRGDLNPEGLSALESARLFAVLPGLLAMLAASLAGLRGRPEPARGWALAGAVLLAGWVVVLVV